MYRTRFSRWKSLETGVVGLDVSTHRFSYSMGRLLLRDCTMPREDIALVGVIGQLYTWTTDAS